MSFSLKRTFFVPLINRKPRCGGVVLWTFLLRRCPSWEQNVVAEVAWHLAFLSEALAVCSWTMSWLSWPSPLCG